MLIVGVTASGGGFLPVAYDTDARRLISHGAQTEDIMDAVSASVEMLSDFYTLAVSGEPLIDPAKGEDDEG